METLESKGFKFNKTLNCYEKQEALVLLLKTAITVNERGTVEMVIDGDPDTYVCSIIEKPNNSDIIDLEQAVINKYEKLKAEYKQSNKRMSESLKQFILEHQSK